MQGTARLEQQPRAAHGPALPADGIGLLIAAARRRLKQVVWRRVAAQKVTPPQLGFLLALHDAEGPQSPADLARRLYTDDPTASRVLRRLRARALVEQTVDPSDRRRCLLSLTPRGRTLATRLAAVARGVQEELERGFSADELRGLRAALGRLLANLDAMDAAPARPARARRAR